MSDTAAAQQQQPPTDVSSPKEKKGRGRKAAAESGDVTMGEAEKVKSNGSGGGSEAAAAAGEVPASPSGRPKRKSAEKAAEKQAISMAQSSPAKRKKAAAGGAEKGEHEEEPFIFNVAKVFQAAEDKMKSLSEQIKLPVISMQGLLPKKEDNEENKKLVHDAFTQMGIETIEKFANWKWSKLAHAIACLKSEEDKTRPEGCNANVNKSVAGAKSIKEVHDMKINEIPGLEKFDEVWKLLKIKAVHDLGHFKCLKTAWAMCELSSHEDAQFKAPGKEQGQEKAAAAAGKEDVEMKEAAPAAAPSVESK